MPNQHNQYPRLIADVGGTNARFAIEHQPLALSDIDVLSVNDYPTLLAAIKAYLQQANIAHIQHIVIAIANPVTGDYIKMTNHDWAFSITEMKAELAAETLLVINDFTAQALAVTQMDDNNRVAVGGQSTDKVAPIAVVGAGTGLGVSGLIPDSQGRMIPLAGEGGHVSFAPRDSIERDILAFAEPMFSGYVSAERLLNGDGLSLLYKFFAKRKGLTDTDKQPAAVTDGALIDKDPICLAALSRYCMILGDVCANTVLTLGATGGLYIGGGIVPRFIDFLKQSEFRSRFEDKGRFENYMKPIPAYIVTHSQPGLLGAAIALQQTLSH